MSDREQSDRQQSDRQQVNDQEVQVTAEAGRGRLARAALLSGYGAAAVVTTAVISAFEPKFPKLVGD
jgi:hypothetical protein